MKSRINAARRLAEEIARIGALNRRRSSGRTPGEGAGMQTGSADDSEMSHEGAMPVSPPNHLSGRLLRVVVSDPPAKEDMGKSGSI